jgi:triacylglycerol lipase
MKRMKGWSVAIAAVACLFSWAAEAANNYPVVLVHGFSGWGRGELFGLQYWGGGFIDGGSRDLQEVLKSNGTVTYTAAVGPVSSNWDRAIELFYQIKGGCVDYGPYHSTHLIKTDGSIDSRTHTRKLDGSGGTTRRCWAKDAANNPSNDPLAMYPTWGDDPSKKIHLVAHSQGGQTVRMLLQLLRYGSTDDLNADSSLYNEATQKNPFTGGKNWVSSITTLASPHDGTTLASGAQLLPMVQQIVGLAASVAGLISSDNVVYDLKLDQWGLKRNAGESFNSYFSRVKASAIWNSSKDISLWDLSPDGAKELNLKVQNFSDVYYFSYATQTTFRGWLTGHHYPILTTFLLSQPLALFMGAYTRNDSGKVLIDSSWWPNDSVVNTRSMRVPTLGSASPSVNFSGTPQAGTWNYMGLSSNWDHLDIVGLFSEKDFNALKNSVYLSQASRLKALSN